MADPLSIPSGYGQQGGMAPTNVLNPTNNHNLSSGSNSSVNLNSPGHGSANDSAFTSRQPPSSIPTTVTAEQIAERIENFETAAQDLVWRLRATEQVFHLMARTGTDNTWLMQRVLSDLQQKLMEFASIEADAGRCSIAIRTKPAVLDNLQALLLMSTSFLIESGL